MTKQHRVFAIYTGVGLTVLALSIVLAIFYDNGYRVSLADLRIHKTSTITLSISEPGVSVFIDEKFIHRTTSDYETVTIPNVESGERLVTAIKNTFSPWAKRIDVSPNSELKLYPFLIPFETTRIALTPGTPEYTQAWQQLFGTEKKVQTSAQVGNYTVTTNSTSIDISCDTTVCSHEPLQATGFVTALYDYENNPNVFIYATTDGIHVTEIDGGTNERIARTVYSGDNIVFYPESQTSYIVSDAGEIFRLEL